jgi:hypothetical protein
VAPIALARWSDVRELRPTLALSGYGFRFFPKVADVRYWEICDLTTATRTAARKLAARGTNSVPYFNRVSERPFLKIKEHVSI